MSLRNVGASGGPAAVPADASARTARRAAWRRVLLRMLVAMNLVLGFYYLTWRYLYTINWASWHIALALLTAETYSFLGACLFGLTIWRLRERGSPPLPVPGTTVDVFITCYNEPAGLVRETAMAARAIRWPHRTYVLDDGNSRQMRAMTEEVGVGYIVRSTEWEGHQRHAKAGNLNNALFQTQGEFILVLDSDQVPAAHILHQTLGYFQDPKVAFVQTPQWFYNVPPGDPFGSQAPLFYGPIQQGKDGWNAAFFCGSNAVLRREALMQMGITYYVRELEQRIRRALRAADRILHGAAGQLRATHDERAREALGALTAAVQHARQAMKAGEPIQQVSWEFQRRAEAASSLLVADDLTRIRAELADIPGLDALALDGGLADVLDDEAALSALASRQSSPLTAIGAVSALLLAVDMHHDDEAQPIMPMATISVTEDMATAMRLHALGWHSVYHHEIMARGLAPEDLRTSLQQRLRWAQGTIQVLLRENPLTLRGLSLPQRLMYLGTVWTYLSGYFSLVYLGAPILYLFFGMLPVRARADEFLWHLIPYFAANQLLFAVVAWKLPTWRGQQYSLALFPLWIQAVTSAIGNVYFGRTLGFVVTPKTRQDGNAPRTGMMRPQLMAMALLVTAITYKLGLWVTGLNEDGVATMANVAWASYDVILLSIVLDASGHRPVETAQPASALGGTVSAEGVEGAAGLEARQGALAVETAGETGETNKLAPRLVPEWRGGHWEGASARRPAKAA